MPLSSAPKQRNHYRRSERGNTMVEASLTITILFMILFGIVGFGRAVWAYSWASHASREATRWASVRGGESGVSIAQSDVRNFVRAHAPGLRTANVTVNATWERADHKPGSDVTVNVTYNVTQLVPWVPAMNVSSTSTMPIAQ
jgi:Flp pilus assembly protein TadG